MSSSIVNNNRQRKVDNRTTVTTHHYLGSHGATAKQFAGWVRGHWGIENELHCVLDVVFGEDRSRVKVKNAGANLAMIRRVAVSLVRRAPGKGSGVTKGLNEGWDDECLL